MNLETLSAELERVFDLTELKELSRNFLGLDPEQVGGSQAKASYARALVERCAESYALSALFDAIRAGDRPLSEGLIQLVEHENPSARASLQPGDSMGDFLIIERLGDSPLSTIYLCRKDGQEYRLKLLTPSACLDQIGVQRFLTHSRILGELGHPGLPEGVIAGKLDGRGQYVGVAHYYRPGTLLSALSSSTTPWRFNEVVPLLRGILQPLALMHERGLCHGNLKLENILVVGELTKPEVILLDAGSNLIRLREIENGNDQRLCQSLGAAESVSPEQIRGEPATARGDTYAFGAVLYRLLTGRAVFDYPKSIDQLLGHLSEEPEPLNGTAAAGSVPNEVEEFVLRLLEKDPAARPPNAEALLQSVEALNRTSLRAAASVTAEEISQRLTALLKNPFDENEAAALESTVDAGADATQLAEGFRWVGQNLDPDESPEVRRAQKRMVFRAARLYENATEQPENAEGLYSWLLEVDPSDESAHSALLRLRKRLGKHNEIIEDLLQLAEKADSASERARRMVEIGRIYERDLKDQEQALVAYSQALCEDPLEPTHAKHVARIAAGRQEAWEEALGFCMETLQGEELSPEAKNPLYLTMGRWYMDHLARPDLALSCYQNVLSLHPAHDEALEGVLHIYRKAQQWSELANALLQRAEAAAPARARDLRFEAADVFLNRLNNAEAARSLYEQVLADDPGHERAARALAQMLLANQNIQGYVHVLEQRALAVGGETHLSALCELADAYEHRLGQPSQATEVYERVLREDPNHVEALQGLDRIYSKTGRYADLLSNLRSQYRVSVTPRQKVQTLERIARICEEQFIDHESAVETCRQIVGIDPENIEGLRALARNQQALGRFEEVAIAYEQLLDLLTEPAQKAELCQSLGEIYEKRLNLPDRALAVYELALEAVPNHADALAAVARLRTSAGDAERALLAIDSLAREARTPRERAEQYLKSAEILESRGQPHAALERYKLAHEANPTDPQLSLLLRRAYVAQGDARAAVELIEREIERTEGNVAKAKLAGEMALLCLENLDDTARAEAAAQFAAKLDPTNVDALTVLGRVAFDQERFTEAVERYEHVVHHTDAIAPNRLSRVFDDYLRALAATDQTAKALRTADEILERSSDKAAMLSAARTYFDHGSPERAKNIAEDLLSKFEAELTPEQLALTQYQRGDAALRLGQIRAAYDALNLALDVDPRNKHALASLSRLHEARRDWKRAVEIKQQLLLSVAGEERIDQLIELGDIAAQHLKDLDFAANTYLTALGEQPQNRKILMKLMQLYSEGKDWSRLVEVILKLAEFVSDHKQRAKYLHTAAMVSSRELHDPERAIELLDDAIEADPEFEGAVSKAIDLRKSIGDAEGVKELLKLRIKTASDRGDQAGMLGYLDELSELYLNDLNRLDQAIAVQKSALEIEPETRERQEKLAQLYARDPTRYLKEAELLLDALIRQDPYRPEPYKLARQVYTKARRPDGAWCACQALFVLNRADPDEVRFFSRMRSESAAAAQSRLTEQDFSTLLIPAQVNPLLTSVFAVVQDAVLAALAPPAGQLGYLPEHRVDPSQYPYGTVYALAYAADVLNIELPAIYQNTNDPGGLAFLNAQPAAIVCGLAALGEDLPPQAAAFLAAHRLTYFRPGWFMRQLVPQISALKAWLFAAIRLVTPQFPVAAELQNSVAQATEALNHHIQGGLRNQLVQAVNKLLQEGASVDLKRWQAGVDLAADRAGFILSDDLQTSIELIRASDDPSVEVAVTERVKDIIGYSVSAEYLAVRERLGVALGA